MTNAVAWHELAFTLPAIIGFLANWAAFNDAVADLHYLQARGLNGAREVVARASCRNEAIRAGIQVMYLLLGMYLMTVEPANPDTPTTRAGVLIAIVIIASEVLMVTKAVLDRRDRHRVIRILAARKEAES